MASNQLLVAGYPDSLVKEAVTSRSWVLASVLTLFFLSNVYDSGGTFRIKYLAFFLTAIVALWALKYLHLSIGEITAGLLLFIVWPLWEFLYGAMRRGDLNIALTQVTPFLFALPLAVLLPTVGKRTPLRLFYGCLFSVAIVVIASFGLVVLFPESAVGSKVFELLSSLQEREGYFGTKPFGDSQDSQAPVFYFRSTLFLVPTSVYYLFIGKTMRAAVILLALAVAWSKAGIFIVVAFAAVYFLRLIFSRRAAGVRVTWQAYLRAFLPFFALSAIVLSILMLYPGFYEQIVDTAAGESETAQIRLGHVSSVTDLFARNPHYLLVGQGLGVPFYSTGASEYVQIFEVDHLNVIRKFGIPWFIGFTAVVFFTAWKLINNRDVEMQAFGFAMFSMYLAAGTNPVLLTPLFIMLITLCYFAQRTRLGIPS
jgi:hypothetical protein